MLLALGVWVLTRRRVSWPAEGWVWPVGQVRVRGRVYRPVITSGFGDIRAEGPHGGVDIVYPRRDTKDLIDLYPPGTPNGGARWFAPPGAPIVAARAGKVWSVEQTPKGWAVVLDHGKPFATFYQHMETPALEPHEKGVNTRTGGETHVNAGRVLGFMGYSPQDPQRVRHLHFAVWYEGTNDESVDPEQAMRSWPLSNITTDIT